MNTRELFGIFAKGLNINKKEVKGMSRPYLEIKVVPVKKEEKEKHYCKMCGSEIEMEKPNGNWVNGENLDKIKFPAFCSFIEDGARKYGEINVTYNGHIMKDEYLLSDITEQSYKEKAGHTFSVRYSSFSLKDLIKCQDIHILKAKIILFEEKNK